MIHTIDLSGEWQFSLERAVYDDTITLPCTTAQARKGAPSKEAAAGCLTERYPYLGKAYYKKTITIPAKYQGKRFRVFLERTRISRLSVNGRAVGTFDSLTTPHCYDVTEYIRFEDMTDATAELEIIVSNDDYPIGGGHMTSPDTQTNWLGILGRMELQIFGSIYTADTRISCDPKSRRLEISCAVYNDSASETVCALAIEPVKTELEGLMLADGKNYDAHAEELPLAITAYPVRTDTLTLAPGENRYVFTYLFDQNAPVLWSEHSPYAMEVKLTLSADGFADRTVVPAGIRSFRADTHDFLINGIPVKLRGKHDALLFPLTGAAPMDPASWLKVMGTAWRYGINHYRYHTCCPPEAAFAAADLLGIYMEPELPFWGTVAAPGEDGFHEDEQNYLIEEGKRILTAYANHPSFCMMSLGNELWGSRTRINEIIRILKEHDHRPLYTEGSNNFQFIPEIVPDEDFFVGARLAPPVNGENKRLIRGSFATCDAPLGVIQTTAPSTAGSFDEAILSGSRFPDGGAETDGDCIAEADSGADADGGIADADSGADADGDIAIQFGTGVKIVKGDHSSDGDGIAPTLPIVSHEIGQYFIYPDYSQTAKYTGVLAPRNLELFKDALAAAGMSGQARDFFVNSGKLAVNCYREELERMHRSRYMAGYQLLDLQDYTGQGTALVGILDAFMDSKGLISESGWRRFCSDAALLASFDGYVCTEGESFSARILLSMFNPLLKLSGRSVRWRLELDGDAVFSGSFDLQKDFLGTETIGEIHFTIPELKDKISAKAVLSIQIDGAPVSNEYTLWIYKEIGARSDDNAISADSARSAAGAVSTDDETLAGQLAAKGQKVLFFKDCKDNFLPGFYCADFWNYTMFRQISESMGRPVAVGTLGLTIDAGHGALSDFACESYATPQWYSLVSACKCEILDHQKTITPIVQMIDNPWRNHKLGIIYELETESNGRLLVCTIPKNVLEGCPEGRALYQSLINYLNRSEDLLF